MKKYLKIYKMQVQKHFTKQYYIPYTRTIFLSIYVSVSFEFWGLSILKSQHAMLPNLKWNDTSLQKNRVNESPLRSRCYTIARMVRMISYTKGSQVILGATLPPDLPVIEKKQRDKHCQIVKYKRLLSSRTDHQTLGTSPKVKVQLVSTLATALLNRHGKKAWTLYQFEWQTKK